MPAITSLEYQAPWQEIRSTPEDWDALGAVALGRMLSHLHVIRAFEEAVLELDGQGLVHGPAHSSIGQEGGAVGVMAELRGADLITGSHRGHHQFLAKGLRYLDEGASAADDPFASPRLAVPSRSRTGFS